MKQCNRKQCLKWKDESEFGKSSSTIDGLYPRCRSCVSELTKAAYAAHKLKIGGEAVRVRVDRKPSRLARTRPSDAIKAAIQRPRTPEEIAEITGIDEQIISDVLAHLYDTDSVKVAQRRFQLVA